MNQELKIEKGVPMPLPYERMKDGITTTLRKIQIGESFVYPRAQQGGLGSVAKRLGIKLTQRKISDTEIRVWRKA